MKLNKLAFILSIVAGVVAAITDMFVYEAMADVWAKPLLIAVMAVIFAAIVCTTLLVTMLVTEESDEAFLFLEGKGALIAGLAVLLVVVFGVGMLLEYIYDRNVTVANAPTSYIFVMDESESMGWNDPNKERHTAVNQLMQGMPGDFPYAVYMFDHTVGLVRDMASNAQGKFQPDAQVLRAFGGGTMIGDALARVMNDIETGTLTNLGDNPRVILLTDGEDYYLTNTTKQEKIAQASKWAQKYIQHGIIVATVGLGDHSVDAVPMITLAEQTGGVYVGVADAQNLAQGFSSAVQADASRDLFSSRNLPKQDWLYALLRVLFLTLLGTAIAFAKALACAREDDTLKIILVGAAAALIGAIAVEVLAALALPAFIGGMIYWILLAITPVTQIVRTGDYTNIPIYQ